MCEPNKQENLWFHGGNLHLSRFYSKYLTTDQVDDGESRTTC
jgi:hypothetical protein